MVEINNILFPYDLTTNGSKIIPYVLSVAEKYNSTIYLLHVVEDLHGLAPDPYPGLGNDQKTHKIAAEKTLLKKSKKCVRKYAMNIFRAAQPLAR